MEYGYMNDFNADLFDEIKFAKKHFDFFELTLEENLLKYNTNYVNRLKKTFGKFKVLGHIHWGIKFSKNSQKEIQAAIKSIKIFKKLEAKKVTIHPSWEEGNQKELVENNLLKIKRINKCCILAGIQLMIENIQRPPFNKARQLKDFTTKIPKSKITFDTGHASKVSKFQITKFLMLADRIEHIHLHDRVNKLDHLEFKDKKKLKKLIKKIKNSGYNKTITFEIYRTLKDSKSVPLGYKKRRTILLQHLNEIT